MHTPFTRRDWDLLPEGFPAQLVAGWLVKEPAPNYRHQRIESRLHVLLVPLVGPDRALMSPADVVLDDKNVYQPDLVVLRNLPPDGERNVGIPLLAVEILSPSTARRDRNVKCARLLAAGTGEVWLVDPEAKTIEVHDAHGVRHASGSTPIDSRVLPGLSVNPSSLFGPPAARP